ncbi:MAG: hypothetical protein ACTSRC_19860 [Candidatus Helarchaeota archaeon]
MNKNELLFSQFIENLELMNLAFGGFDNEDFEYLELKNKIKQLKKRFSGKIHGLKNQIEPWVRKRGLFLTIIGLTTGRGPWIKITSIEKARL